MSFASIVSVHLAANWSRPLAHWIAISANGYPGIIEGGIGCLEPRYRSRHSAD